jgi:imidazolonepropionase-like amidohydrolase
MTLTRAATAVAAVLLSLALPDAQEPAAPAPGGVLAIRGVTVIAMTDTLPMRNANVIVRGDRIDAIGPAASTAIPAGATIVEGAGKFLVPGFIEMHAHTSKTRASALGLFVANGVTTLRDMGGDHEELLGWRREIRAGRRLGPRMVIAGPYLESHANIERMRKDPPSARVEPFERLRIGIATPDEARRVVGELAGRELDFLKIRTVQDQATYLALNQAANQHRLKLVGHVGGMTPDTVLESGQDGIDHFFYPPLAAKTPQERLAVWERFARRGIPIVPTLIVLQAGMAPIDRLRAIVDDEDGRVEPRRNYLSKYMILDWREQLAETTAERQAAFRKGWDAILRDVREMHQAGMEVLAGSDVAVLNVYPGSSLHDEMAIFVRSLGMKPAESLDRATRRSARFLGLADTIGTIERGKIADLVLLDASPLADIGNTRRIAAVIMGGRLFDRDALQKIHADVARAPDRRTDEWGRR